MKRKFIGSSLSPFLLNINDKSICLMVFGVRIGYNKKVCRDSFKKNGNKLKMFVFHIIPLWQWTLKVRYHFQNVHLWKEWLKYNDSKYLGN